MYDASSASIMNCIPTMPIWAESECETFFADGRTSTTELCQVRIADGRIVVDAGSANIKWMYEGEEIGTNHFRLTSHSERGEATLHRIDDEDFLSGWWRENQDYGMWRIRLARPDSN